MYFSIFSLNIVQELVTGLNTYFNFTLASLLLYNFEREQYGSFFPVKKLSESTALPSKTNLTFSPPISPLSTKLISPRSYGNRDSKETSPSNSRASSVSEYTCHYKRVFPNTGYIERKSTRDRKTSTSESINNQTARRKTRSSNDEPHLLSPLETKVLDIPAISDSVSAASISARKSIRETRSSRSNVPVKDTQVSEEMSWKETVHSEEGSVKETKVKEDGSVKEERREYVENTHSDGGVDDSKK